MIKARRLFLLPALSMFLLLIPFIGLPITIIICLYWYIRNQETIHLYFRGINYLKNEFDNEELEKGK